MRVFGVDFTSVPRRRKPITVAVCALEGDVLAFERIEAIESLAAFEAWLKADGPWVAGFDFPFGQSRTFLRNMNWPAPWAAYVEHVAGMSRAEFRATLEAYKAPRAPGDKEHSRSFERGTGAASPQKLYGVPVALMFYEGAPCLLRAGLLLPGLHAGDSSRIALEAYPGMAARALYGSNVSYKNDQKRKQTAEQLVASRTILRALTGAKGRSRFGVSVAAPNHLAEDPTGDHLDALICAAQAAWGHRYILANADALAGVDALEGWIADPALFGVH